MPIGLITYQDAVRAEDVNDIVTNISPSETPLLSGLGVSGDATNTLHETMTDTFGSYSDNAQAENVAFTVTDLTQPTRLTNKTQIFAKWVSVSGTERAVKNYSGDPMAYQLEKQMVNIAKDIELALMAGSTASGSSGVARRLAGVINGITSNATARASGSSLGEVAFNDIMQLIYTNSAQIADEVYVGAALKRDITGFSATNTRMVAADDKRLINSVAAYESDFGIHKIFLHRNVPTGANALALVAIKNDLWKVAYLTGRRTKVQPLPIDGDRDRAQIIAELTLENRGEKGNAYVSGFTL